MLLKKGSDSIALVNAGVSDVAERLARFWDLLAVLRCSGWYWSLECSQSRKLSIAC